MNINDELGRALIKSGHTEAVDFTAPKGRQPTLEAVDGNCGGILPSTLSRPLGASSIWIRNAMGMWVRRNW